MHQPGSKFQSPRKQIIDVYASTAYSIFGGSATDKALTKSCWRSVLYGARSRREEIQITVALMPLMLPNPLLDLFQP